MAILPLILVQAAGWRRPIRSTWLVGLPFGTGLGILYSVTTISGPPLAILFNNQGLVKNEFRAGLALVRVAESSVTAIVYYQLGLFMAESANLLLVFICSIVVGVPLGAYVIRRLDAETFRRICMSFDAWVVGFGLSRVLIELELIASPWAYGVLAGTILIDAYLLYIFFATRRAPAERPQPAWAPAASVGEFRQHLLALGRQAESKQGRQQKIIRQGDFISDDERTSVGEVLFHHLERPDHLRHGALHDQVVSGNAEFGVDETLVGDVVDHLRIEVPIQIPDPLIHARALARVRGRELRAGKHLVHIGGNGVRLIKHEVAVLERGHAPERVALKVHRQVHFFFRVVEAVFDVARGQNEAGDLHEGAARETKQGHVGHLSSPCVAHVA